MTKLPLTSKGWLRRIPLGYANQTYLFLPESHLSNYQPHLISLFYRLRQESVKNYTTCHCKTKEIHSQKAFPMLYPTCLSYNQPWLKANFISFPGALKPGSSSMYIELSEPVQNSVYIKSGNICPLTQDMLVNQGLKVFCT